MFIEPGSGHEEAPLFELADNEANGNKVRGHIALVEQGERHAGVTFVDLGFVLHLWTQSSAQITPETARALGEELIAWADRKER
jgi:hypothetical protein